MYGKARIVISSDGTIAAKGKFPGDRGGSAHTICRWRNTAGGMELSFYRGKHIGYASTKAEAKQLAHDAALKTKEFYLARDWVVVDGSVLGRK